MGKGYPPYPLEGKSASAGSAALLLPRAAAREAPLIEQENLESEKSPVIRALFLGILKGSQREIKKIHRRGAKDAEKTFCFSRHLAGAGFSCSAC